MKRFSLHPSKIAITLTVLLISACATTQPIGEMTNADQALKAIRHATEQGAETIAPSWLAAAQQRLKFGSEAQAQQKPAQASRLFAEAEVAAILAMVIAQQQQSEQSAIAAEKRVEALRSQLLTGGLRRAAETDVDDELALNPGLDGSLDLSNIPAADTRPMAEPTINGQADYEATITRFVRLESDPAIRQFAAAELYNARLALDRAELAQRQESSHQDHYTWLLAQRLRIAETVATGRQADERREAAKLEARELEIEARAVAADDARRAAEARLQQAELAAARSEARAQTANQQLARAQHLEQMVSALRATQTPRGLTLTLGESVFELGEATLSISSTETLDQLAAFLNEYPRRQVVIEGFTDSIGTRANNQSLSERRAQAVREGLINRGVDGSRISARGYGEAWPVATNSEEVGRRQNRRVEIIISDENGLISPRS